MEPATNGKTVLAIDDDPPAREIRGSIHEEPGAHRPTLAMTLGATPTLSKALEHEDLVDAVRESSGV